MVAPCNPSGPHPPTTWKQAVVRAVVWRNPERLKTGLVQLTFVGLTVAGGIAFFLLETPSGDFDDTIGTWLLRLFAFVVLASLPSWLYVRFLTIKLESVYTEYVLNLHRLRPDHIANLPGPPAWSEYAAPWREARRAAVDDADPHVAGDDTVYDKKFSAYFGRSRHGEIHLGAGNLIPVVVVWAAFASGWLTVLLDPLFRVGDLGDTSSLADMLRFAFLGAYVFSLQLIVRAYFQNDLRAATYVGALERLAVVLVLTSVIHLIWQLLPAATATTALEAAFVFLVGSFPLVGQQWINQFVGQKLRIRMQNIVGGHPLDSIDGLNVWYQARLIEEGVESVQNLATSNLVDIMLHSRAPVGRLVDWVDQALLIQHLPPADAAPGATAPTRMVRYQSGAAASGLERLADGDRVLVATLQALGVRTASDLLELFSPLDDESLTEAGIRVRAIWTKEGDEAVFHRKMVDVAGHDHAEEVDHRMRGILRCLGLEPNLKLVLHWQEGMKDYGEQPGTHAVRTPAASSTAGAGAPTPSS